MIAKLISLTLIGSFLAGCAASLNEQPGLDFSANKSTKTKDVPADFKAHKLSIKSGNKKYSITAFSCQLSAGGEAVLLINPDERIFDKEFCSYGASQAFLAMGYQVIGVNRLGFGNKVERDFAGPLSQSAIVDTVQEMSKKFMPAKSVVGIWSDGVGSIAAGFASKKMKSLKWWISGNGIFDMEELSASTKDAVLKSRIKLAQKSVDESDFMEERSLGWDTSGLPKTVVLYHGSANKAVSAKQASSFRDTLASEEFTVHLEPEIVGVGAVVSSHQLKVILNRLIPVATGKNQKPK